MRIRTLAILAAVVLLAACGGGTTEPPPPDCPGDPRCPPPPGPTVQPLSGGLILPTMELQDVAYRSGTDKIELAKQVLVFRDGRTLIEDRSEFLDRNTTVVATPPGGVAVYTSAGNRQKAVRAVTPSGEGTALSVLLLSQSLPTWRLYERLGETVLPTGTATYRGDYLGTLTRDPDAASTFSRDYAPVNDEYIRGQVDLEADFATARISGRVTQRASNRGRSFTDIRLRETSLGDRGIMDGRVAGGELAAVADRTSTRDEGRPRMGYQGVITGPGGTEAVGTVAFDHIRDDTRSRIAREVGVFVATSAP